MAAGAIRHHHIAKHKGIAEHCQKNHEQIDLNEKVASAENSERSHTVLAVTVDYEVIVERNRLCNAEALHHSKAGSVDDREGLVDEAAGYRG